MIALISFLTLASPILLSRDVVTSSLVVVGTYFVTRSQILKLIFCLVGSRFNSMLVLDGRDLEANLIFNLELNDKHEVV